MARRKVIITGSTGLLGLSLIKNVPAGHELYAGYFNFSEARLPYKSLCEYLPLDITNKGEVEGIFKRIRPDVVIHAASIGSVDYCERNKKEAQQVNIEGSRNIITSCRANDIKMIFTSSNAVFGGSAPPYKEGDKPNPIDYYGATKLTTEEDLAKSGIRYAIARLITMYGWNHPRERQNPVTWLLEKLKKRQILNVVNDIYNNHLFADNAAEAVWAIVTKKKEGIYHIGGSERASRYELACSVAEIFGFERGLIKPVDSSFFPSIAPRPKDTSYNIDKMEKELSVKAIGIKDGLTRMKNNPPEEWTYEWQ